MKLIYLSVFLIFALSFGACSKKKWKVTGSNGGPNGITIKLNSSELGYNAATELGTVEKDGLISTRASYKKVDGTWTSEQSFSIKPTTDPANDEDVIAIIFMADTSARQVTHNTVGGVTISN